MKLRSYAKVSMRVKNKIKWKTHWVSFCQSHRREKPELNCRREETIQCLKFHFAFALRKHKETRVSNYNQLTVDSLIYSLTLIQRALCSFFISNFFSYMAS